MKRSSLAGLLALAAVGWGGDAVAQQAQLYCRQADNGAFVPVQPGQPCPVTIAAGTAIIGSVSINQTIRGVTNGVAVAPTSAAGVAITSVVTGAGASSQVLKASAGNLYSAYATNLTGTAGFLVIINATSAPVDGAITPLACVPLPANGVASIKCVRPILITWSHSRAFCVSTSARRCNPGSRSPLISRAAAT